MLGVPLSYGSERDLGTSAVTKPTNSHTELKIRFITDLSQ